MCILLVVNKPHLFCKVNKGSFKVGSFFKLSFMVLLLITNQFREGESNNNYCTLTQVQVYQILYQLFVLFSFIYFYLFKKRFSSQNK